MAIWLVFSSLLVSAASLSGQNVEENLFITHLPDARIMGHFQFSATWDSHPLKFADDYKVRHFGVFPKSLAEVMSHYEVQELHLSLTQGKWRTHVWGYPPISAPPGAELWAWFLPQANAESEWSGLVNAMSGLLCAHLNAIGPKSSFQPLHSFKPQGVLLGNVSSSQMRYAALPRETVCTENFTPWTKLLPCGASAGLGSLFSALVLFNTDYHSLGVHFKPVCLDEACSSIGIQLQQTLTVVFPPSLNSKGYSNWSLKSLFGKAISSSCPLASISRLHLARENPTSGTSIVVDPPPLNEAQDWMVYDLAQQTSLGKKFDLSVKSTSKVSRGMPFIPVLNVQRFLSGSGHEWGGLHTLITNSHTSNTLRILYLDMIPWYFRLYLHTLQVQNAVKLYEHYQAAKDRQRPHTVELLLEVPPQETASISVEFNRAFLKWTEHPPDAHHGFYINSAVLTTVLSDHTNCTLIPDHSGSSTDEVVLRVHTEPLLVSLPTPDFSMPYNVICFVCTVIAIGFGSIFNLTTRKLEPATPENSRGRLQLIFSKLTSLLKKEDKADKQQGEEENREQVAARSAEGGADNGAKGANRAEEGEDERQDEREEERQEEGEKERQEEG